MIKIIEELYNGNIDPTNKRYNQYSPYVQFAHEKNECLEKLLETLDETEKELFQKFCKAESQMQEIRQYDHFTYALKLGILLMVETYSDLDSLAG